MATIHHKQGGGIMKGKMLLPGLLLLGFVLSFGAVYAAPDNPAPDSPGWNCPWGGQGRGMHCGQGRGCPKAAQCGFARGNQSEPITYEQARGLVEKRLRCWNNPNLKLGDFSETDAYYEATIVTKDNSLVQKVQMDKNTGRFRNVY
jgi:hypothetical protein